MIKTIRKTMFILALGASSMMMASGALAQEWPLAPGDYWEVTGIDIKDGGGLKYAEWLASEWRENLEFSKSQGWIKDFMILSNVHARSDEPDLYLVTVTESIVSAADGQERMQEYMAWRKKTLEQMVSESGNRAEYREVMSESLLQVLSFRD
ncbi:hypothetical protein GWP57_02175 [Gammaproteobacteria bacterium]|jgi:hypothetical protein|nr:hypothetical protein [Gammaproteobacteria bacterium]